MLSHAGTLAFAPPLQRRTVPSVHPYTTVARSSAAMSALPEPPHWPVGHLPISPRVQTLLVPWLQADLQRPYCYPTASDQATAAVLDSRHFSVVSVVFIPAHRERIGCPYPDQLPLVLVAAQCGLVLWDLQEGTCDETSFGGCVGCPLCRPRLSNRKYMLKPLENDRKTLENVSRTPRKYRFW
jgi:hypothetical protein